MSTLPPLPVLREYSEPLDGPAPAFDRAALVARLREALPARCLRDDAESLEPYSCDGLSAYRATPSLVVLPEDTAQVQATLRACREFGAPVVARGSGTGLSGGATPLAGAVVLGLARLDRILDVDLDNCTATVQPGVRNLALSEAVAAHGLHYAPDPSSQIACSIGGNVAENAGGVHCLKYGLTLHNLLAVEFVTPEGEIATAGGPGPDAPGLDLLPLLCGSEGMLGVITSITVKLTPVAPAVELLVAAFDEVAAAGRAVERIIGGGIIPAGLEMMDNPAIRAAEQFAHAGYPVDAAAILLCELDGDPEDVAGQLGRVRALLDGCGARSVTVAADAAERQRLWSGRKGAFPAVGRLAPDYYCMDGTIPRRRLAETLAAIGALSREYGLGVANVFHAGDGNLHPLIMYDANLPGQLDEAEALGAAILELCVQVGGTITGEHGVGREKLNQMCVQFSEAELAMFRAVKAAFDPAGLLNPGKVIPTLRRCAEGGRMHVHAGRLPFPDLERF
jgi:glycolate oxidase